MTYQTDLRAKQRLSCPRCNHVLVRGSANALENTTALSIAALVCLLGAVCFSFLAFTSAGQSNEITLLSVWTKLYELGYGSLGAVALVLIVVLPGVYLCALTLLTLRAKAGLYGGFSLSLAKTVTRVFPWTMADVFIIGVLVAVVKMNEVAEIGIGFSFWSYIAFTLLLLRISTIVDTHQLWYWASNDH